MNASFKKNILIGIASLAGVLLLGAVGWLWYFNAQFSVYQDDQYKFSIKYPKTWQVIIHPAANVAVVFVRPKDTPLDTLQESFNVTVQPVLQEDRVLTVFSAKIRRQMPTLLGSTGKIVEDKDLHWDWREGHMMAIEQPLPRHLKMVNAWVLRGSQAYILTFLGDMNKYAQNSLLINEMIHSLQLQ